MSDNPYQSPETDSLVDTDPANQKYASYDEIPIYRKRERFFILYFTLLPIAFLILMTGDVYYELDGKPRAFSMTTQLIAAMVGISGVLCGISWLGIIKLFY